MRQLLGANERSSTCTVPVSKLSVDLAAASSADLRTSRVSTSSTAPGRETMVDFGRFYIRWRHAGGGPRFKALPEVLFASAEQKGGCAGLSADKPY